MPRVVIRLVILSASAAGCSEAALEVPPPPVPASLDELDQAIAQRIKDVLTRIEADPRNLDLRVELGMVYAANALSESARDCLQQAVDHGMDTPRVWYHLAHLRADDGDLSGGLAALQRVENLDPSYAPASWQAGLWHLDRGDADSAEAAFRKTARIEAASPVAVLGTARVHLQRAEHAQAARLLEQYLATSELYHEYASQLLALAYRGLGRFDEAEEALQRGAGSRPRFHDLWMIELESYAEGYQAQLERARNKAGAGDFNTAIDILNDLKRGRSVNVEVYNNLGLCYLGAEEVDNAVEVLEQAVRVNPNSLEAHHLLAGAYWLASDTVTEAEKPPLYELASSHVQRALEINPAYVPALGLRGDVLYRTGNSVAAIDSYREAARWDPQSPQWPYQAALVHGSLRQWDSVVALLEEVIANSPAFEDAMSRLGLAYIAQGRLDDAEATLRRAISLNPDYAERIRQALGGIQQRRQR